MTEYSLQDGVAHLRLDDGKANVLNDGTCSAIEHAIAQAAEDEAGALVVWGRPRMFCGGIDLEVIRSRDEQARAATLTRIAHTILTVWTAPLPTVAAITGHAIAGGALLTMACDRRLAVAGTWKLGVNETQLGMSLPSWAVAVGTSAVRIDRWTPTFLEGRLYDPQGAVEIGWVERVVEDADLDAAVRAVAAEGAALPTGAYGQTKQRMRGETKARVAALVGAEMGAGFAR